MKNKKFFLEAIKLAEKVKGLTSPNPSVGCVIEKDGKIVGKGATQKAGFDHAEIVALKEAGSKAADSTVYVTLEPCVDYEGKRTPSCAKALIDAKVKKVIIGMKDPNPKVKGKGIEMLKKAGIQVEFTDYHHKELLNLNEDFFKYITSGKPFIYAKAAITIDGNIATSTGDSKWISCEESRNYVHRLRNKVDAVLVGAGTVLKDNPKLNVRIVEKHKDPLRIVIDPAGLITEDYNVMNDELSTLFIIGPKVGDAFKERCDKFNKEYLQFDTEDLSFKEIFELLGKRNITSILVEGGGRVFYRIFNENQVDKILLFIAPKMLLGLGIPFLNGKGKENMCEAVKILDFSAENIGEDILIQGYLSNYGNDCKQHFVL
ncbi:MAG: bifunctional diaminohydroxyphosphoribosylaminopyrimidine deaminase/5-amino-6-(5-phosphoribosylamino)uracil reductase RibD [Brevinematales bacterium]|nr:bifunctional diaminohydroxyphosphoribosylaminopyrimidine deaminase/5-amino-6-(5-phosphoribosylamino)uracil reductase RibD [Brevinematales bacterium]